jgi:hypothetical protein
MGSLYLIIDKTIEVQSLAVFPIVIKIFSFGSCQCLQFSWAIKLEIAIINQITI